jgi:predicted dehydrogenase
MSAVRWGILGAAKFAREHMGPALHLANGSVLAAIATRSAKKAVPFEALAPGIKVYDDYDALLAAPDIDAVYVPLPNTFHVEWGLKALEAGKHVLIEKPVAMKAEEIDALIAKRDETGLLAAEAYMIVHHPQWHRARDIVRSGVLGKLRHITAAFSFNNQDIDNIRNRQEQGGGALPDIGVYAIGCARYVTGLEGTDVRADIEYENGVDVLSRFQAHFGDASYSGYVSTRMHLYQEVVFHGEAGLLKLTAPFNAGVYDVARLEIHKDGLETATERFPNVNQYVEQVQNFCAAIEGEMRYPWTLEDAQGTQKMIDMVYAAGHSKN